MKLTQTRRAEITRSTGSDDEHGIRAVHGAEKLVNELYQQIVKYERWRQRAATDSEARRQRRVEA